MGRRNVLRGCKDHSPPPAPFPPTKRGIPAAISSTDSRLGSSDRLDLGVHARADFALRHSQFIAALEIHPELRAVPEMPRSEERSAGKGCVRTCRSRWSPET